MHKNFFLNFFSCLIVLLSGNFSFSQIEISGKVTDSLREPIAFAHIFLKPAGKDNIVAFTSSDTKGEYILSAQLKGDFELSFTALSFKTVVKQVSLVPIDSRILDIVLPYEVLSLDEVIVQGERAIIRKEDTVIFRAAAFLKGDEVVVEDLLRRIPGLTVDADGTIKVGNREIEKVMVDGDDFFEKGYKLLTKNMNAEAIDNIFIYERYSNNRLLKGIEESERVALNLTLKEGYKQQWFGNMSLGYGMVSKNRYSVRTNIMSFGKKAKYYFLGNLNNVGIDASGDLNHLIRPSRYGEPGQIGEGETAVTLLHLNTTMPRLKRELVTFNNTELASLNGIFNITDNINLKTTTLFNWDEIDFYRNSFSEFSIGNTQFLNVEDHKMRKKTFTGFGKVDLTYDISKNKMLEYVGKFNFTLDDLKSELTFNTIESREKLYQDNQLNDHKITYTNKIADSKVFLLTGRYLKEKLPQRYTNSQFLFSELFSGIDSVNSVSQLSENSMQFAGLEGNVMNRKENGNLLEIKAGFSYRDDRLNTSFMLEENGIVEVPEGFNNNLKNDIIILYGGSQYSYRLRKMDFTASLNVNQIFNKLKITDSIQNNNLFYVDPGLGFQWRINDKNRITSQYKYSTSNTSVEDVYPGFVLSNFRNFTAGTGSFEHLNASSFVLNHTLGNWSDKFFATTSFNYVKNHDFFTTNNLVTPSFSQSRNIIIKDRELMNFNTSVDRYLKAISSNLKINVGFTRSNYKNIVNEELRNVNYSNFRYGAEIRSGFLGMFNFHLGTNWLNNNVSTSTANFKNIENISFLDISLAVNKNMNFNIQSERYFFNGIDSQTNQYYFLDFVARYTTKNQKFNFMLSGKNLFNTNTFRDINIDDLRRTQTEYRLVPRYALLSIDLRF